MKTASNTKRTLFTASLLTLLLSASLLFAGCEKSNDPPAETKPDTTVADTVDESGSADSESSAETTTQIPGSETIADAGAYLDKLLAAEEEREEGDNFKTIMDLTMDMSVDVDGYQQELSMPMKLTEIVAGSNMHILSDSMGETYELIYVDGTLYIDYFGEFFKCTATPEQFEEVSNMLSGSDTEEDDTPNLNDILTDMKASEIFGSITAEKQAGGATVVTVKGFNKATADKLAPEMMEFFASMGMVGGNLTEDDYMNKTEEELEAILIADTAKLLSEMSDDAVKITFTADSEDILTAVGFEIALSTSFEVEGETAKTSLAIKGDITHTVGGQSVKAPADADKYEEGTWDDFFGEPSFEDMGLVPDENGVYTLSEDPLMRAEQIWYIYSAPEQFVGTTFRVSGAVELIENEEDGSTVMTITLPDAEDELATNSAVDAMFAEGKEDALLAGMESGKTYVLTGTFGLYELEGFEFLVFIVDSVSAVAVVM